MGVGYGHRHALYKHHLMVAWAHLFICLPCPSATMWWLQQACLHTCQVTTIMSPPEHDSYISRFIRYLLCSRDTTRQPGHACAHMYYIPAPPQCRLVSPMCMQLCSSTAKQWPGCASLYACYVPAMPHSCQGTPVCMISVS